MERKIKTIGLIGLLVLSFISGAGRGQDSTTASRLSPTVKSFLIPGTGEIQLGETHRGRGFLVAEGALWISLFSSFSYASYQDNTMRSFAARHAGVDVNNKTDQYWIDIGNYSTLDDFNAEHERWRDIEALYDPIPEWNWSWDSKKHRTKFENLRISRDRWQHAGQFIIGGIIMNHVISAIDALFLQRTLSGHELTVSPLIDLSQQPYPAYRISFSL